MAAERTRATVRRAAGAPRPAGKKVPASAMALDRVIHERLRLGIVSALAAAPSLTFGELKELLGTTDGNLSVHARRLEEAGYVGCKKTFEGRTPRTEFRLTENGRRALRRYLDHMEALIDAARARLAPGV
jgi:DNA-binding MarR family transcriptional regulator